MTYLMGDYGNDNYRFVVRFGQPILASRNNLKIEWNDIPYAIRCWVHRSIDANGREMDAHPFPQPPKASHE